MTDHDQWHMHLVEGPMPCQWEHWAPYWTIGRKQLDATYKARMK